MRFSLYPSVMVESLGALTPERLDALGISALLLDFDNTVVPYTTSTPTPQVLNWFDLMQRSGVKLCVVSNSHKQRVQQFCDAQGLPCIRMAAKPSVKGLLAAMEQLGVTPTQTAMVGDQIFTDVLAGNRAGVRSILVRPILLSNAFLKLRHQAEKPIIAAAKRRGTL